MKMLKIVLGILALGLSFGFAEPSTSQKYALECVVADGSYYSLASVSCEPEVAAGDTSFVTVSLSSFYRLLGIYLSYTVEGEAHLDSLTEPEYNFNGNAPKKYKFAMPAADVHVDVVFSEIKKVSTIFSGNTGSAGGKIVYSCEKCIVGEELVAELQTNPGYECSLDSAYDAQKSEKISTTPYEGTENKFHFTIEKEFSNLIEVYATCKPLPFNLTYTNSTHCRFVGGHKTLDTDSIETFSISCESGYGVRSINVVRENGDRVRMKDSLPTYSFVMPAEDVKLSIKEEKTYKVTCNEDTTKLARLSCPMDVFAGDTVKIIEYTKREFNVESAYYTTGTSSSRNNLTVTMNEVKFVMPANSVQVYFKYKSLYLINLDRSLEDIISYTSDGEEHVASDLRYWGYAENTEMVFKATENYVISNFKILDEEKKELDVTENDGAFAFLMPEKNLEMSFDYDLKRFKIIQDFDKGCSMYKVVDSASVTSSVKFALACNTGYLIDNVSASFIQDSATVKVPVYTEGSGYVFTMPCGDVTLKVKTKRDQYPITTKNARGTAPDSAVVGDTVTATFKLGRGETAAISSEDFDTEKATCSTKDSLVACKFVMPKKAVEIDWDVSYKSYAVSVSAGKNGEISLDEDSVDKSEKSIMATYKSQVSFDVKPADGYQIDFVRVHKSGDEKNVVDTEKGDDFDYTFEMPDYDVVVEAAFVAKSSSSSAKAKSSSSAKAKSSSSSKKKDAILASAQVPMFSVTTVARELQIAGAQVGAPYAILDMQGRVMMLGRVDAANFSLSMPRAGSYMLRIAGQAQKVTLR